MLAGTRHGFHGRFDLNGDAVITILRGTLSPLHARLHLDLGGLTDKVSGTLSDGNWTSAMAGDRNVFSSQLRPAQQAGSRTLTLSRSDDTAAASGLSKIAVNGVTRVRGTLVDGRPFATASALSKSGDCPFYLSLNHGTEVVIGWLNFPIGQGPSANGTVLWVKSGTNSFAATLQAVFLFGGPRREDKTRPIPVAHGDVVVWGGVSRLWYHGVRPLKDGEHPVLGRQRINLTFRQALR